MTTPIFDETGEYIIRALKYRLPPVESDQIDKPSYTFVFIEGGDSDADANIDVFARTLDSYDLIKNQLPFRIESITVLPHIASSARTTGKFDPAKQDTMAGTAEILESALAVPELKTSKAGIIFMGFSLGGAQATELAARYGDACKTLILADPAGHSYHPNLLYEYTTGAIISAVKRHGSLLKAYKGLRDIWGSYKQKKPGLLDMAVDMLQRHTPVSRHLARAYGFEDNLATKGANIKTAMTDSTRVARQKITAPVIYAPNIGSQVCNDIISRLKTKYPTGQAIMYADKHDLETDVQAMLSDMFPRARNVIFCGWDSTAHASVRIEKPAWDKIFSHLAKLNPA